LRREAAERGGGERWWRAAVESGGGKRLRREAEERGGDLNRYKDPNQNIPRT
jgi:hypothetical protein